VLLCSLVGSTNILEESGASAFRRVQGNHYPEDGNSTCLSFRKLHATACYKITVVPFITVVISNVISCASEIVRCVRYTKNVKCTAVQMRLV